MSKAKIKLKKFITSLYIIKYKKSNIKNYDSQIAYMKL